MSAFGVIAGATTAALVTTVLWAPPMMADHYVGFDPAGDMVKYTAKNGVVATKMHHNGDIRKVLVRYLPHRLTIRVDYYRLFPPKDRKGRWVKLMGFIRTDRRAMPAPYLGGPGGPWQWEAVIPRKGNPAMGILDALTEEDYQCYRSGGSPDEGMEARINYHENFAYVSYPRHCIAGDNSTIRPRWVRVSVSSESLDFYDYWISPNDKGPPNFHQAFYATPRLHAG